MKTLFATGKVINGRMTTTTANGGTSKYVGKTHEVAPVSDVKTRLDIPSFMVHNKPVTKPNVKANNQSFASILALVMQYE